MSIIGFLGGLASGYASRQERDDLMRRQALQDQKEANDQANFVFNQLQELVKSDQADEAGVLDEIRNPSLDQSSKVQLMEARRLRHQQNRDLVDRMAAIPGMTKVYGDVRGLLQPSNIAGPGFQVPLPDVDPLKLQGMAADWTKRAGEAIPSARPAVVEQGRASLGQLASAQMIDALLPKFGSEIGRTPSQQAPTALQNPEAFFKQYPTQFTVGKGGERVLPTGAIQKVYYEGDTPMVKYETPVRAMYDSPEAAQAKLAHTQALTQRITTLLQPQTQKAIADAEQAQWKNRLSAKQFEWFDRTQNAKIRSMLSKGSGAGTELRRLGLMLAHQRGMMALGMRQQGLDIQQNAAVQNQFARTQNALMAAMQELDAGVTQVGKGKAKGSASEQQAGLEIVKRWKPIVEGYQRTLDGMKRGDASSIQQAIGETFGGNLTLPEFYTPPVPGQQMSMQDLLAAGMLQQMQGGGGAQYAPPQPPANLTFNIGGGSSAPAPGGGGGARPVVKAPSPVEALRELFRLGK